jgi:ParB family chromosome partitioning protein
VDDSLDALLGLSSVGNGQSGRLTGSSGGRLVSIPIASVEPNDHQPRRHFDEEGMTALADSIGQLGVLQPVLVRPLGDERYQLIAGERRWRAARRAGLTLVPAIIRDVDDQRSLEEAVVENLHRADLNALEEAAAYRQLIEEFGLTQELVAERVGRSRSAVANTLRLFQLPTGVQRLVATGVLSAGHARALLGCHSSAAQIELAGRAVAEELSVREVEHLVRSTGGGSDRDERRSGSSGRGGKSRPAALLEMEHLLSERLETRVTASIGRGRGKLVVEFADLDDLDRIYQILNEKD